MSSQVGLVCLERLIRPEALLVERLDHRRQQSVEPERLALGLGERGAFVQKRSLEKVLTPLGLGCDPVAIAMPAASSLPTTASCSFRSADGMASGLRPLFRLRRDDRAGDVGTELPSVAVDRTSTWSSHVGCYNLPKGPRTIQSNSSAFTTRDSTHHPSSPMLRNECRPVVGTLWPALRSPRMISSHTRRRKASG